MEAPLNDQQWIASIFQPMQEATDAVDKSRHSVVLSLYIMQCIVHAHHEHIDVTSTSHQRHINGR
jgi:K+-sensing histidine kinase KdpD